MYPVVLVGFERRFALTASVVPAARALARAYVPEAHSFIHAWVDCRWGRGATLRPAAGARLLASRCRRTDWGGTAVLRCCRGAWCACVACWNWGAES